MPKDDKQKKLTTNDLDALLKEIKKREEPDMINMRNENAQKDSEIPNPTIDEPEISSKRKANKKK